ncbi:hypothetical protein [Streptomyces sp. NPDC001774]
MDLLPALYRRAWSPYGAVLTARHQVGLAGPAVAGIKAWASYDDGATWTQVRTEKTGPGKVRAIVRHPDASDDVGFVTLRVRAWDTAGNSVDQTVVRAYGLRSTDRVAPNVRRAPVSGRDRGASGNSLVSASQSFGGDGDVLSVPDDITGASAG